MNENLIETKSSTNIKPDSWYKEFAKVYGYAVMDQSAIRFYHEFDIHSINTLEENQRFLEECKEDLKSLGIKISPTGVINLCSKTLQNGYLVSQLLRDIAWEIHCFKKNETDIYKQFKFENYQKELYVFIELNVDWRNKERDFNIHMEIKKGTLYQEIAEKLELTVQAVSVINLKV